MEVMYGSPVSYTHLDVYKRQVCVCVDFFTWQTITAANSNRIK